MLLDFHPDALDELDAAVRWYEQQRPGHGRLLHEQVRRRVGQAARYPQSGAPVLGCNPSHDVRCFGLHRFPFCVVTAEFKGQRLVVAVAHTCRRPGYWQDRLG